MSAQRNPSTPGMAPRADSMQEDLHCHYTDSLLNWRSSLIGINHAFRRNAEYFVPATARQIRRAAKKAAVKAARDAIRAAEREELRKFIRENARKGERT